MKHCPACNFSFPDSQGVCDFDGTELVQDPERQALMKVKPRLSPSRPGLKKPMLLTSLAVLGLFLSAVFIGYLESPAPSIPAIVKDQEAQNSPRNPTPVARTSGQPAERQKTNQPLKRTVRSQNNLAASTARLRQKDFAERRLRNNDIARTRDSKRTSNEKSPKIAAILKGTWRVLKKPFDF